MRDTLPANNAIMQMDFAENYKSQCNEKVQSAYFDGPQVTLHPVVVYARNEAGELKPSSYIIVSDKLSHSASTVYTFVRKMIPIVKKNIRYSIFCSDMKQDLKLRLVGTISNRDMVKAPVMALVEHASKRLADDAIKQQQVAIQYVNYFFFK